MKARQQVTRCLLALLLVVGSPTQAASVHAGGSTMQSASAESAQYLVSAVLKRDGTDAVIKLVHSSIAARTPAEAIQRMLDSVKSQYRDYTVLDTLASPLATEEVPCRSGLWATQGGKRER